MPRERPHDPPLEEETTLPYASYRGPADDPELEVHTRRKATVRRSDGPEMTAEKAEQLRTSKQQQELKAPLKRKRIRHEEFEFIGNERRHQRLSELLEPLSPALRYVILQELAEHLISGNIQGVPLSQTSKSVRTANANDVPYLVSYIDLQLKKTDWIENWIEEKETELSDLQLLKSGLSESVQAELEHQPERFERLANLYQQQLKMSGEHKKIVTSEVDLSQEK